MSLMALILEHDSSQQLKAVIQAYAETHSSQEILGEFRSKHTTSTDASRRLRQLRAQFELLQAATGIRALEEITAEGTNGTPGYGHLLGLANFIFGKHLTIGKIGEEFRKMARERGLPELTPEHQQYIDAFSVEYVASLTREQLQEEVHLPGGLTLTPGTKRYHPFLAALSRKIQQDQKLQLAVLKTHLGYEVVEDITPDGIRGKPGYKSLRGICTFIFGSSMPDTERGKKLRELAQSQGLPLLTPEHQAYVDGFTEDYLRNCSPRKFRDELDQQFGKKQMSNGQELGVYISTLGEKVRSHLALQFAVLVKYTDYQSVSEIIPNMRNGRRGYGSVPLLSALLFGKKMEPEEIGRSFRELFILGTLQSGEFQQYVRDHKIDLRSLNRLPPSEQQYLGKLLGQDFLRNPQKYLSS